MIRLPHAIAIYMASVLGAGILITPGLSAQVAGQASILAWILLSALSYPFAYTFAKMATMNPQSGGIYSFSRQAFGKYTSNSIGWLFMAWFMFGAPANAIAAGYYLSYSIPMTRIDVFLFAGTLIALASLINYLGMKFSARVQILVIVSIVVVLIIAIGASLPTLNTGSFVPLIPGGNLYPIGVASALIIWAFFGYENVPNLAGEIEDPEKVLRRAVLFSVVIIGILYVSVSIVIVGTGAYKVGGGIVPFEVLMSNFLGKYGMFATSIIAVVAVFSTANAYIAGMSRVIYSVSKSNGMPSLLSNLHPVSNVPYKAITLMALLGLLNLFFYFIFNVNLVTAFLMVSGIGGTVYVVGSAAGIRLLKVTGWKKFLPWISLITSIVILSFINYLLILTLVVVVLSIFYTRLFGGSKDPGANPG